MNRNLPSLVFALNTQHKRLRQLLETEFGTQYNIRMPETATKAIKLVKNLVKEKTQLPVLVAVQKSQTVSGQQLIQQVHQLSPETFFILITDPSSNKTIHTAYQHANLFQCIAPSHLFDQLPISVNKAIQLFQQTHILKQQVGNLQTQVSELETARNYLISEQTKFNQINHIAEEIRSSLDIKSVCDQFIKRAVQTFCPRGSGSIMLYEKPRHCFVFYSSYGLDPKYVQYFEIEATKKALYTYDVVFSRQGRIMQQYELEPFQTEEILNIHYGRKYLQQLVLPIYSGNTTIGLVTLSNYRQEDTFGDWHLRSLENLCQLLSSHFENSRLYSQVTQLNSAYERFVPHDFLNILNKPSILDVRLGDHIQKQMTILFSDIHAFTSLSENITPRENFRFINSYFSKMGPIIRKHDGFIDKFIGDSIMALFNSHAHNAIASAVEMFQLLEEYNQSRGRAGYVPIPIGVGINSGSLMLGILGEKNRMESTVISDAVNVASRLESMTKIYGTPLLTSEETLIQLPKAATFITRFVDRVQMPGKTAPITIIEVLDAYLMAFQELAQQTAALYTKAWNAKQQHDYPTAIKLLKTAQRIHPDDPLTRHSLDQCLQIKQNAE